MMSKSGKWKISTLLAFLYFLYILDFPHPSRAQFQRNRNNHKEVETCTAIKKKIFEVVYTYRIFSFEGEERKVVIDKCRHYDPFVVGGVPALPKEFPPMARIGHHENGKTRWFCGGTLLSAKYVLTAAHCFYSEHGEVNLVRLGELDFSRNDDEARPEDFGVEQTIDHPQYDDDASLYNDIGLILLNREVVFDSFKHPACLPVTAGDEIPEFIATGWGNTRYTGEPVDMLQKVKLDRFNEDKCRRLARRIGPEKLSLGLNTNSQICAGSNQAKDTCNGDSGGPLFAYHQQYPCMYYLVGVTSAGIEGCGRPGIPAIYTRVYYYMDWIKSYIYA